jgi:hypothetical protein
MDLLFTEFDEMTRTNHVISFNSSALIPPSQPPSASIPPSRHGGPPPFNFLRKAGAEVYNSVRGREVPYSFVPLFVSPIPYDFFQLL